MDQVPGAREDPTMLMALPSAAVNELLIDGVERTCACRGGVGVRTR